MAVDHSYLDGFFRRCLLKLDKKGPRQERINIIIINKKDLKQTCTDVQHKRRYCTDEHVQSRKKILTFVVTKMEVLRLPQPQDVLSMFLNVGHFSASCS